MPLPARPVMITALVLNLIGFANYAAVLPQLREGTGLSEAEAGIAGGVFFLAYAIGAPLFAGLTDTRDARRLYIIGGALGIAGGLLFPLVDDGFAALVASRALTGLGMAGTYMPGLRLLIEALPADRQQRAAGDYASTLTLGLSASFALSGTLQWAFGWPAAFLGAAATAAAALALVRATMPSPRLAPAPRSLWRRLASVVRGRHVPLLLLAAAGNSWEGMAFRTWWIALLGFAAALPGNEAFSGVNFALATAFVGLLAMPLSAFVVRRAEAGRRHRVIALAAGSSVLVGAVLALMLHAPFVAVFLMTVAYLCAIFADAGAMPPALLARVAQADRGAALALLSAATNSAAFMGVVAVGFVLHAAGGAGSATAWQAAILAMAAGSAVTAAAMLAIDRASRNPPA
jgi:predicted MFS family arabinose efflux permease